MRRGTSCVLQKAALVRGAVSMSDTETTLRGVARVAQGPQIFMTLTIPRKLAMLRNCRRCITWHAENNA